MLPHVHGEEGDRTFLGQGAVGADGLGDLQAGGGPHQPGPAGAEGGGAGGDEFLRQSVGGVNSGG